MKVVRPITLGLALMLAPSALMNARSAERQSAVAPGDSQYVLERGDIVELSIVGLPDARFRAPVGPGGMINLPLAGQINAAGNPLSEVHAKVQSLLATKPFRTRAQDGREMLVMVAPEQVILAVAEYRPVYLNGDISKPGQQDFRPGMTIRQAVALAGGYDVARFRMNNPVLETADLRAEYESLWMRFAAQQGYVQKLRSKLENDNAHIADSETKTPVREETAQRIDHLVNQDLSLRNAAYQKQRSLHVEAIENEERRIEVLSKSVKRERDGAKNDAQQLERLHDAERRGIISPARMADLRRSALGSETRSLRSEASLIEAERSRDDLKLKLQQLDSNRNIDLAGQLQAATLAMETTRIKLQSASEKLAYSGIIRSQLASGEFSTPEIKVIRGSGVLRQTGTAREDDELQPGDVVEISLRSFGKGLLEQQAGAQAAR